jgi:hypothetical protein
VAVEEPLARGNLDHIDAILLSEPLEGAVNRGVVHDGDLVAELLKVADARLEVAAELVLDDEGGDEAHRLPLHIQSGHHSQ